MAKGGYLGVGGTARKIKKGYIGIGGTARKIKKGYLGVGGVARLIYNAFEMPVYTGACTKYGNESKGRIEITGSGTITLSEGVYDVMILDGGREGYYVAGTYDSTGRCMSVCNYCPVTNYDISSGRGGNMVSLYGRKLSGSYSVTVAASMGSSFFGSLSTSSGTPAYSGKGSGSNGSGGSGTTTKPFGGDSTEFSTPLSAGGSDASGTAGGHYGGGAYNSVGIANTGGGGGRPSAEGYKAGGSGKVIIRWGY